MIRPFVDTLREIRQGALLDELADALHDIVAAVEEAKNKGSITLTLSIRPATTNTAGTVFLEDDIKVKKPLQPKGTSLFFVTPENNLSRKDPKQSEMELTLVETPKANQQLVSA